jgi:hypothetical protein
MTADPRAALAGIAAAQRIATDAAAQDLFVDAIEATINDTIEIVATFVGDPIALGAQFKAQNSQNISDLIRSLKIPRGPAKT